MVCCQHAHNVFVVVDADDGVTAYWRNSCWITHPWLDLLHETFYYHLIQILVIFSGLGAIALGHPQTVTSAVIFYFAMVVVVFVHASRVHTKLLKLAMRCFESLFLTLLFALMLAAMSIEMHFDGRHGGVHVADTTSSRLIFAVTVLIVLSLVFANGLLIDAFPRLPRLQKILVSSTRMLSSQTANLI